MIPPEKAEEYQQVAALVCMDIDTLLEISQQPENTVKDLQDQIALLHEMKEDIIKNPEKRKSRYNAACALFGMAIEGAK